MGRAKIDIEKIEDPSKRKFTFSKRRSGLFKKAYELSVLSASDVVVITRHPTKNKLRYFSHPKRAEDVLIRFLNMPHDDLKVKHGNGQETRFVIPNKDSLIAKLQNCKIQEDTAAAEEISIEQGNSGAITSGDDNQLIQHTRVINPEVFPQQILDFKRFYQTATPMTPEQFFDDYEEKLKVMLSHIEQRQMLLQQQQQSIVMQTNAFFANMQLQQLEEYSMHAQQRLVALQDQKNKGKAVTMEPNPVSMQQVQGRPHSMQLQQPAHNMQLQQQWQPQAHNKQWAPFYQNNNGNMLLSTEGSLQAPIQITRVTQQEQERSSMNNGHINPTGEQYFNQMGFLTGLDVKENNHGLVQPPATSSHVMTGPTPMLSPNTIGSSTYHTTEPPYYFHQQSIGDDANNWPDLGQYNDKPNFK